MLIWDKNLDPFLEVYKPVSPAFMVAILKIPGYKTSVHLSIYLPTHGKDYEFVNEMANLRNCLDDLIEQYSDPIVYIRGDGNVNKNNIPRVVLLQQLVNDYSLVSVDTGHTTYHHFVGQGEYDSKIDLILHSKSATETISQIICKHENPTILSHHDMILSDFSIPRSIQPVVVEDVLMAAPRVQHTRVMIQWTDDGQAEYENLVGPLLRQVRQDWLDSTSQSCMSILLQLTNDILNMAATASYKSRERWVQSQHLKRKQSQSLSKVL